MSRWWMLLFALPLAACQSGDGEPPADADGDGFADAVDCAPDDAAAFPGAEESCNGVDDNCNGLVDDDPVDASPFFEDLDGDGFGDREVLACETTEGLVTASGDCDDDDPATYPGAPESCTEAIDRNCDGSEGRVDGDGDGTAACEDCDDSDPQVSPEQFEICDGVDNDCDGATDEPDAIGTTTFHADADGDGFGDPAISEPACTAPEGFVADDTDCDDATGSTFPGADETCNGADDDCDGETDEPDAVDATDWPLDLDGDGFGDLTAVERACEQPAGTAATADDCDDLRAAANPAADEVCNELDDDCDGTADEPDAVDAATWYLDDDSDGFGDPAMSTPACAAPSGYVDDDTDCDDADDEAYPGADETCDEQDDDCDGSVDEEATDALTFWLDYDGDGYGGSRLSVDACEAPSGYVDDDTDCNDLSADDYPGADETCDEQDDDCDGSVDEDAVDQTTFYADVDEDGYGDPDATEDACEQPSGYVVNDEDCDDEDEDINPLADEVCNDEDDDCDGTRDDNAVDRVLYFVDDDGDGYGTTVDTELSCDQPSGYAEEDDDCDDDDDTINPGATETCNEVDDDCDGDVDESGATGETTWYLDDDGDGYGDEDLTEDACDAPTGYVDDDTDCDDGDDLIYPGATERCNDEDDDCDTTVDDGVLGTGSACPAESCAEILDDDAGSGNGTYWLDDGGTATRYACDMSYNGGGWTVLMDWRASQTNLAGFESYFTKEINNMGYWRDRGNYLQWADYNSNADVLSYRLDVPVPNDGDVYVTLDYRTYSHEDSGSFWMARTGSTYQNIVCWDDSRSGGSWSSAWSSTERNYQPYACPNSRQTGSYTRQGTWRTALTGEIDYVYFRSFHYDGGGGDWSYLYTMKVAVR